MPFSGKFTDELVEDILTAMPDERLRVLDIGAGNGKYGAMVRNAVHETHVTAVEIERDYVNRFGLKAIYDQVRIMDAMYLLHNPDEQWDLVIIGDTIEHLRKSYGRDLIEFLLYRCKWLLIIYPRRQLQNTWEGYVHEAHISAWSHADFLNMDADYLLWQVAHKDVVLINGYQQAPRLDIQTSFPALRVLDTRAVLSHTGTE
jgi:SAM-dependent methyltransferase